MEVASWPFQSQIENRLQWALGEQGRAANALSHNWFSWMVDLSCPPILIPLILSRYYPRHHYHFIIIIPFISILIILFSSHGYPIVTPLLSVGIPWLSIHHIPSLKLVGTLDLQINQNQQSLDHNSAQWPRTLQEQVALQSLQTLQGLTVRQWWNYIRKVALGTL